MIKQNRANRSSCLMVTADRVWQVFVGIVLVITGAGICYAFLAIHDRHIEDFCHFGVLLVAEAYSLIGSLFVFLGLRYIFGSRSWIERRIASSLSHVFITVVILSLVTLVAYAFVFFQT